MKYKNKSGMLISLKVDASNVNEDAEHRFVSDNEKNTYDGKVTALGGDLSNTKINNFDSVTTEFPIPEPGESTKTILGKMRKFLQDFNTFKTNIITLSKLANNLTTTSVGMALDARQGKVLKDEINTLNGSLGSTNNNVAQLQQNITNVMPGSTYIDIPNPYTAVRDGWAFLTVTGTNEGHVGLICSNGFSYTQPYLKKDAVVHMYIPVRKGQTVSFNGLNFTPNVFRFY